MTKPEPARRERPRLWQYAPVTFFVAVACAGIFVIKLISPQVIAQGVMVPDEVWSGEVWRLVTSVFLHVDFLHVAFNVAWWIQLGQAVEVRHGGGPLLGLTLLTGVAGSAAELAGAELTYPGSVGLSGAVFGLFFFGHFALRPLGGPFAQLFSKQNAMVFLGFFVLGIVLTKLDLFPIANLAHFMGGASGALVGIAVGGRGATRRASGAAVVVLAVLLSLAAYRPSWLARWHYWRASELFDARQFADAALEFRWVAEAHPEHLPAKANVVLSLFNHGDVEAAAVAAAKLTDLEMLDLAGQNRETLERLRSVHPASTGPPVGTTLPP